MAKSSGLAQQFYIGGYDLSGDVGAVNSCNASRSLLDVTAINKSGTERINGLAGGQIEFNTWFDDGTELEHAALSTLPTADRIVTYCMGGAVGNQAACMNAKQVNYDWSRGTDGSLAGTVSCESTSSPLEWCELLTAGKITHASAASSASKDDTAQTTAGFIGYLQIVDTDSGTPTVVVEDSANDSVWATLLSFTAVASGSEPAGERKTVTGTVDRYLRVTTTGTFTNCDFVVAYRRGTALDDVSLS